MFKYLPFGAISAAVGIALAAYHLHLYFLLFLLVCLLFSLLKNTPALSNGQFVWNDLYAHFMVHQSFETDHPVQEKHFLIRL